MKKVFALIMAGAMVLGLAACGSSSSDSTETTAETVAASSSDKADIEAKGTLVVGITDFEPMDYQDADGNWIGFDADLATAFAESLGVDVEFQVIDWDNKVLELDAGTIDCVWNGMTLTDEVLSSMECSNAYCNNAQTVIVPADIADSITSADDLADMTFAVESGSAAEGICDEMGLSYTAVSDQATALMEASSGTCDGAIIDALMAAAMVGEGTSYADLAYTIGLNDEEYGVGFRQGSDMAAALNDFFADAYADGTIESIAEQYGIQASILEQ